MVLLNGRPTEDEEIDPSKHKFIGMFRYPNPPTPEGYVMCPCKQILQVEQTVYDHWQKGHFDIPQYIDINPDIVHMKEG